MTGFLAGHYHLAQDTKDKQVYMRAQGLWKKFEGYTNIDSSEYVFGCEDLVETRMAFYRQQVTSTINRDCIPKHLFGFHDFYKHVNFQRTIHNNYVVYKVKDY